MSLNALAASGGPEGARRQTQRSTTSVTQLVIDRPGRAHIFEHLGLDYCCGGDHSLATACREKNLDPASVTEMLDVTVRASPSSGAAD
ncbi:DUF542 domain-containing protein [Salinibacter altiplanensis]|uniref:DUF542 domain-containing protein n=1 Tax=Salinibacter altiplanensis TaxID=1803181 RepID=UPI001F442F68|nr:DUF542 domain-containing protein [Salinibacter altiplanensis]